MRSGYLGGIFGPFGTLRGHLGRRMGDEPPQEGHGVGRIIFELFGPGVDFLLMKNAKPDACERINTYRLTSYAIQTGLNHHNYINI